VTEALDSFGETIRHLPILWGLAFLFCGAMIEYVFPPFPGDTIVLFGKLVGKWEDIEIVTFEKKIQDKNIQEKMAYSEEGNWLIPNKRPKRKTVIQNRTDETERSNAKPVAVSWKLEGMPIQRDESERLPDYKRGGLRSKDHKKAMEEVINTYGLFHKWVWCLRCENEFLFIEKPNDWMIFNLKRSMCAPCLLKEYDEAEDIGKAK